MRNKIIKGLGIVAKVSGVLAATCLLLGFLLNKEQYHDDYIRASVGQHVVKITRMGTDLSGGSGFFVKAPSGEVYILTNRHVCEVSEEGLVKVHVQGVKRAYKQRVIERSNFTDLCLVEAPKQYKDGINVAGSIRKGEHLRIVGHPKLMPLTQSKGEYIGPQIIRILYSDGPCEAEGPAFKTETIDGFFGSFEACVMTVNAANTTAQALPGNSGSPVVNTFGHLVAVLFAGDPGDNWGSVVTLSDISKFLEIY